MKIDDCKVKLKDVSWTPYDDGSDGYLYYTLQATYGKRTIEFKARDFPVLQYLGKLKSKVDNSNPICKERNTIIRREELRGPWVLEHSLELIKYDNSYKLMVYESFGYHIELTMTPPELDKLIAYIDKKVAKATGGNLP